MAFTGGERMKKTMPAKNVMPSTMQKHMQKVLLISLFVSTVFSIWLLINSQLKSFEVEFISLEGELSAGQREEIYARLATQSLERLSLEEIRLQVERKLWVSHVAVERQWPDSIILKVVPEKAIAEWNENALINEGGKVFQSDYLQKNQLAQLYGPEGSEKKVMQMYQQLNSALLKIDRYINWIRLDERGSWSIKNDLGMMVLLGKDDLMERIQRLIKVSDHLRSNKQIESIAKIDMRYSNGVAVSWKENKLELANTFNRQREQKL